MKFYRKIIGERLYLSPFDAEDVEMYSKWAEWMNNKAVADSYGGNCNRVSLSGAKKMIEKFGGYRFAVVLLESDILIGHVSLHDVDHISRNAFMGICIGEDEYRDRGYGTEAVRLILSYGFKTLNLHNIMLTVHADNYAAIKCYEKAGFKEVGKCREWVYKNGKYVDKIYMDILEGEFKGEPV